MSNLTKIEADANALYLKAKNQYGVVSMKIANEPIASVILTAILFFVLGRLW
jgi:hypothetical protein